MSWTCWIRFSCSQALKTELKIQIKRNRFWSFKKCMNIIFLCSFWRRIQLSYSRSLKMKLKMQNGEIRFVFFNKSQKYQKIGFTPHSYRRMPGVWFTTIYGERAVTGHPPRRAQLSSCNWRTCERSRTPSNNIIKYGRGPRAASRGPRIADRVP